MTSEMAPMAGVRTSTAGVQHGSHPAGPIGLAILCATTIIGGSFLVGQAPSQPPAEERVVELRIEGNQRYPVEKIVRSIHTRAGRAYDPEVVEEDVRRLIHTRMFVDVQPATQRVPGGRVVIFRVRERLALEYVKFVGCQKLSPKVLAKEVALKVGDPFDRYAAADGRRKLQEFYHSKGFPKVHITIDEGEREGDQGIVYVINEGPKARHLWTGFRFNTFASDAHLRTLIKSKPLMIGGSVPIWLFGGNVDLKQIEEDKNRLEAYYHSMGFFRAKVGRELEYNDAGNWLYVTYVISEGPRFQVRNVSVLGNDKFTAAELTKDLKLKPGRFFNQNEMLADQLALQDVYGGDGYVFADVTPNPRFLEEPGKLDVVYRVVEGGRYRVGKINVKIDGDYPHTRVTTVLNRLSLRPGDVVDLRELRASERRLRASQLFAVDPLRNVYPRISFTRPPRERREDESELADQPRPRGTYRGQSPESSAPPAIPRPYEAYRPAGWGTAPEEPIVDVHVNFGRVLNPDDSWSDDSPDEPPAEPVIRGQSPDSDADAARGPAQPNGWSRPLVPVDVRPRGPSPASGEAPPRAQGNLRWLAPDARQAPAGSPIAEAMDPGMVQGSGFRVQGSGFGGQGSDHGLTVSPRHPVTPSPPHRVVPAGYFAAADPRDRTVYRGQSGTYDGNEGYPAPVLSGPEPSRPVSPPPQPGPDLGSPLRPVSPAPGSYPAGSYPGSSYSAGPANSQRQQYTSRPEGEPVRPPLWTGGQATINDAVPLLGAAPNEEPAMLLPLEPTLEETTTGRFIFSVGVNSDLGLLGSVVVDEQNFDWTRLPQSWDDVVNGKAFRGAGQRFRLEAMPGTQLQRYAVSFTEPYVFDGPTSLGLSAYYYDRRFFEWTERHLGGRIALGRQLLPDLSATISYGPSDVRISNPIVPPTAVPGIPEINEALGSNAVHRLRAQLTHDTRDNAFLATEGYLLDLGFEQVLGSFQYPRGDVDLRKYFLLRQHPDGSGRHVLTLGGRLGITGDDTPIYDHYFIGGFTTLRGFSFRDASPRDPNYHVVTGGHFSLLASAEYMFPITADDTLRGVVFCDSGVVQPSISDWRDRYRASVGFGLRITVPAMGPAPIALDFAFPVSKDPFDQTQVFSFFIGFLR